MRVCKKEVRSSRVHVFCAPDIKENEIKRKEKRTKLQFRKKNTQDFRQKCLYESVRKFL